MHLESFMSRNMMKGINSTVLAYIAIILVAFATGLLMFFMIILWNSAPSSLSTEAQSPYGVLLNNDPQASLALGEKLRTEIEKNGEVHLKTSLHQLTKNVHLAGTNEQYKALQYIADEYASYGLEVKTTEYEVMLSYPNYSHPNSIWMQESPEVPLTIVSTGLGDAPNTPEELNEETSADRRASHWWNAYSANGSATGKMVYANYGRQSDFEALEALNVSVNGTVVLIRYGKVFRGDKVQEAGRRGAVAVILFSDPADYGPLGGNKSEEAFPNSEYLPAGAAQRGSVLAFNGDPVTPLYPSKPYAYRLTETKIREELIAPKIPVTPIGYRDVKKIFANMNGLLAPAEFQGGIEGINYTLTSTALFQVNVNAITVPRRKVRNVFAYLRGATEPDKQILLTNHVDAWTYGALDPNSGTAAILELARALTTVANETSWRPKRTIVFCSFDAEEPGLIGSTEYVEEYLKVLQQRAVALVNVDIAVKGHVVLLAMATPTLYQTLIRAAKLVPNPNLQELDTGRKTMYDSWLHYYGKDAFIAGQPFIPIPDDSSDHSPFLNFAGVPSAYIMFHCDPAIPRECYALYHTMDEVPWTVEHWIDPAYKSIMALTKFWAEITLDLSDSLIIPFNVNDYAAVLTYAVNQLDDVLQKKAIPNILDNYSTVMVNLKDSVKRFAKVASIMQTLIEEINAGKRAAPLRDIELLNGRLTNLERAFINDRGLYPGRVEARHVLFAASLHDKYSGTMCAGVLDSVGNYMDAKKANDANKADLWLERISITISELQYAIESAILVLDLNSY